MDTPEKRWLNALFGNVTWCTSDQQNNSSEGFFVWSITVKSWIWMAIHCNLIQLFFYSRNTEGCRSEAKLPQIRPKLVFSLVNTAFTLLARWASKGVTNKKASTYPPGQHIIYNKLQIFICFAPSLVAIKMFNDHSKLNVNQLFN